ncbi:MAG: rhodanese-like domain-containing protein [Planctomycetota bacterium]
MIDVTPATLAQWLANGNVKLIDVREPFEHANERIDGAVNIPIDTLRADELRAHSGDARVVLHCRTGKRSTEACERFADGQDICHLAGGIEAWKADGRPTERSASAPRLDVMRQVQMTAGSLVLIGVIAGSTVSPWLYGISAFVGAGLVFAGASGWCGMAKLLARMPWNRVKAASSGTPSHA